MKILVFTILSFYFTSSFAGGLYSKKSHTIDDERRFSAHDKWVRIASNEEESLKLLLKELEKSPTGERILKLAKQRASKYGKSLTDLVLPGEGSITDTTLVRKFSPSTPNEVNYESRSKVYLNRHLIVKDALLDLAHELTHFALRDPFNPYKTPFGLKNFISSTIEGKGGEVEAYLIECQVLIELYGKNTSGSNCYKVVDPHTGRVNKARGVQEFYRLGRYFHTFSNSLKKHQLPLESFQSLSKDGANFISSAYGLPYPLAAVHEYESIMERVCQNDNRRLQLMAQNINREPAQLANSYYETLSKTHEKRCGAF